MTSRRRVVVTGAGLVTPLGCGSRLVWQRLCQGHSGIRMQTFPPLTSFPVAAVPRGEASGEFNASKVDRSHRDSPAFIQFAMEAAVLAAEEAGFPFQTLNPLRAGACLASGIGSIEEIVEAKASLDVSHRKVSPYFVPRILINMAAGAVSMRFGLKGPLHACSTACAAGGHAIGDAYNFIRLNYADVVAQSTGLTLD